MRSFSTNILALATVLCGFVIMAVLCAPICMTAAGENHYETVITNGFSKMVRPLTIDDTAPAALMIGVVFVIFAILTAKSMKAELRNKTKLENQQEEENTRELVELQNRVEQRMTNLETILMSRTHSGVPTEKL